MILQFGNQHKDVEWYDKKYNLKDCRWPICIHHSKDGEEYFETVRSVDKPAGQGENAYYLETDENVKLARPPSEEWVQYHKRRRKTEYQRKYRKKLRKEV